MAEILFLMSIRNRKKEALASIKSIVETGLGNYFDFLVVQDIDKDNLSLTDFDKKTYNEETVGKIEIINTKLGGIFYKTKMLNHGIRASKQKFIVQQDADIRFNKVFLLTLLKICSNEQNFKKYFFSCPYVESENMTTPAINKQTEVRKKGDIVSQTHILYRPQLEAVHGYDERMRMWNEEKDLMARIVRMFDLAEYDLGIVGISNTHITHGNETRSGDIFVNDENFEIAQNNMLNNNLVVNNNKWGELGSE